MNGDDFRIISDQTTPEGLRHITAIPSCLVCSSQIDFDLSEGQLHNVRYIRGCNGNLQAVGRLLEGMDAHRAAELLQGINCGGKGTACGDQLARILKKIL